MNPSMTTQDQRSGRRGPQKWKQQVTLRLSKAAKDRLDDLMFWTRMRQTDILEEALWLALKTRQPDLPPPTNYPTYLLENLTIEQLEHVRRFAILLVLDQLPEVDPCELVMRDFCLEFLKVFGQQHARTRP